MRNEMTKEVEHRSAKATHQKVRRTRDIRRVIYLNEDEDATVRSLSEGLGETFAGVIRALLFKARYTKDAIFFETPIEARRVVLDSDQLDALLIELKRIGVNINQCAKSLNSVDKSAHKDKLSEDDEEKLRQASASLRKIRSDFRAVNERSEEFFDYAKQWGDNQESEYWRGYRDAESGFGVSTDDIDFFDSSKQFYDEEEMEVS